MSQAVVLIAAPNAAVDHLLHADVRAGTVQRTPRISLSAGGKGVNVARALATIGRPTRTVIMSGGRVGALLHGLAADEGLFLEYVDIQRDSRIATICVSADHHETVLNEPGPSVSEREVEIFYDAVLSLMESNVQVLACVGSLPPGAPSSLYGRLLSAARTRGIHTVVDTTGEALHFSLGANPDVVKINLDEAMEAVGFAGTAQSPEVVVGALRNAGARSAVITLGPEGAIACDERGALQSFASESPSRYAHAVGAGDVFTAALIDGLIADTTLFAATRGASQLASRSTATWVPGQITQADCGCLPWRSTSTRSSTGMSSVETLGIRE